MNLETNIPHENHHAEYKLDVNLSIFCAWYILVNVWLGRLNVRSLSVRLCIFMLHAYNWDDNGRLQQWFHFDVWYHMKSLLY